jgi:hypothetical protein
MVDEQYKPFGSGTIEGAFLNDIEYAFDNDETVTVNAGSRDEVEIDVAYIDLKREQVGTEMMGGMEYPVVEMVYELTVPVELVVHSGEDVVVDGFEATWTFENVDVESVTSDRSIVVTKYISKSYGETETPDELDE